MNSNPQHSWSIPQRQSSAGLLILFYKATVTVVKAIWPVLLVVLVRNKNRSFGIWESLIIVIPAIVFIKSLLDFFYFRFYIEANDLIIKKGFLSKKTTTIPLNKIQGVNIEQTWMHRVLNVSKIRIDTAGSEKAEAVIDAIDVKRAEQLRTFLLQNYKVGINEATASIEPPEIRVIQLSVSEVLKLGLTTNHIQTFFIVLAFGISMLDNLEQIFGNTVMDYLKESSSSITFSLYVAGSILMAVLVVSLAVSLIRIALAYFKFQLSKTGKGYFIQSGLINTKQHLVPFSKIQFISWGANWIRKKINVFTLRFHQVNIEQDKRKQRITVPVFEKKSIDELLREYHFDITDVAHSLHRIHRVYPYRKLLLTGIPFAVLAAAIAYYWMHWNALLFLLFAPYIFISWHFFQRNYRLYVSPDALQVHSGVWGRKEEVVKWNKIQMIELKQSIYQRNRQLASIVLQTAAGNIKIPYVNLQLALHIQNYALFKIESDEEGWM